jgi:hypothetical protein
MRPPNPAVHALSGRFTSVVMPAPLRNPPSPLHDRPNRKGIADEHACCEQLPGAETLLPSNQRDLFTVRRVYMTWRCRA